MGNFPRPPKEVVYFLKGYIFKEEKTMKDNHNNMFQNAMECLKTTWKYCYDLPQPWKAVIAFARGDTEFSIPVPPPPKMPLAIARGVFC